LTARRRALAAEKEALTELEWGQEEIRRKLTLAIGARLGEASQAPGYTLGLHTRYLRGLAADVATGKDAVAAQRVRAGEVQGRGALLARRWPVDAGMVRYAWVVRAVDRGQGGAEIGGRTPARVAMGEHLHRLTRLFVRGHCGDQFGAVAADRLVDGDVFVANL